jgi:23S rRNA pseudouridine2457 synthase
VLIAFHKPFGCVSQFRATEARHQTLSDFSFPRGVYPLGRLDAATEGLLLLSDEAELNTMLLHPRHRHSREYWAQVERIPSSDALAALSRGVVIGGRTTLPCRAWLLHPQPEVRPRVPPIRFRKNVPDRWIALELIEGRNHQVRRMTAAIGHPTLRLIRVRIGSFPLGDLAAGGWRLLQTGERAQIFARESRSCSGRDNGV